MNFTSITGIRSIFPTEEDLAADVYNKDMETAIVEVYGTATSSQLADFKQELEERGFKKRLAADEEAADAYSTEEILVKDCIINEFSFDETTGLHRIVVGIFWLVRYYDPTGGRGWPQFDADLGLEEIVFDEWPHEYLPDGFPEPVNLNIVSMEQKKNGLFITFFTSQNNLYFFNDQLKKGGYDETSYEPRPHYRNPRYTDNLDRYYVFEELDFQQLRAEGNNESPESSGELFNEYYYKDQTITYQIIRGEDTERYWASLEQGDN
jgi:hypothetical protein